MKAQESKPEIDDDTLVRSISWPPGWYWETGPDGRQGWRAPLTIQDYRRRRIAIFKIQHQGRQGRKSRSTRPFFLTTAS